MFLYEFAEKTAQKPDTVATYVRRNKKIFKNHVERRQKQIWLDEKAVDILLKKYPEVQKKQKKPLNKERFEEIIIKSLKTLYENQEILAKEIDEIRALVEELEESFDHKQAEQGKVKSYVQDIALAVLDCKETAISRQTFIRLMNERGYGVDWQDSHKYITYTDLAREQAGEKACKIRDNKLEKYYNMDFGKESMEHEFERNARTAEAEQSKRATSRVKPTEPDRAGKQFAQRSVGDVERELRGIDEAVKSRTSKGRAEQAERRRAEQEAHQRAEAERRAAEEQQRIASRRYIGRDWEPER